MNDRIKLAEARGFEPDNNVKYPDELLWLCPPSMERHFEGGGIQAVREYVPFDDLPDPENDANDDYAVLEWMRKNIDDWVDIEAAYLECGTTLDILEYRIGNNARAALKVIEHKEVGE